MKPQPRRSARGRAWSRGVVVLSLSVVLGVACGQGETATRDPLAGTKWEITSVWDGGVTTPTHPNTIATLVFVDGSAGGSTGCNRFSSAYSVDGDAITFREPVVTGSACDPEHAGQGDAVIQALQAAKRFAMSDQQLELADAGGTVQLQLRPAGVLPLEGITWWLVWYGNGTSPFDGTDISLTFRTEGTLTGIAGCNDYSADYRIRDDQLSIEAVTHTEKACLEPDGVMNQEADYLEAIRQSASFTTTLTGLELLDADGNPIAEYRFGGRIRNTPPSTDDGTT